MGRKAHGEDLTLQGVREVFARAQGHTVTKGFVQGHRLGSGRAGCGPATWLQSQLWVCECHFQLSPQVAHPSCGVTVIILISWMEKQRLLEIPGKGWCAPGSFLHYLHPWGPEGSLSAPTDMNFCAVGSDGPISGHWPTAVAAAPYQTPSRPHLSPGQGSQRGLLDSYLAGEARASDVVAGLCWGLAGLVSPRALPSSGHLGDVGAAHALPPLSPGTLHKSKALCPVLCPSKPLCLSSVNVSPSLSLPPILIPGLHLDYRPQM